MEKQENFNLLKERELQNGLLLLSIFYLTFAQTKKNDRFF